MSASSVDIEQFSEQLDWQEDKAQYLFGAALVEHLAPNYRLFCEATDSGDAQAFFAILDTVWEKLAQPNAKINFEKQREKLEALSPDPEMFDNFGVYPAQDACVALAELLESMLDSALGVASSLSRLSFAGIEFFAEQMELDDRELLDAEFDFQVGLLAEVVEIQSQPEQQKTLRRELRAAGVSNLGIEAG